MFYMKYFLHFLLIHFIVGTPQLNLYYTDGISEGDDAVQHTCLQHASIGDHIVNEHQVISYCLSELPSKFKIETNDLFSKFTFGELSKQNISSRDLYLWSAPVDIIEEYQFYLNENDLFLSEKFYYNCTMPRFGPQCQYQLSYNHSKYSSLGEIIKNFYSDIGYQVIPLTCYTHLKCNHGLSPSCLHWSEICDGEINCIDGGFDEEHCWQLEINQCNDNEYRCRNGQCIPKSFQKDGDGASDCFDASDELSPLISPTLINKLCKKTDSPSLKCEDIICLSFVRDGETAYRSRRLTILSEAFYKLKASSFSPKCWSILECVLKFIHNPYGSCELCERDECFKNVEDTCPDMLYFPNISVLFGNVYFAYKTNALRHWTNTSNAPTLYICYETSQYDDRFLNISKILFNKMTCVDSKPFLSLKVFYSYNMFYVPEFIIYEVHHLLKRYHLSFNYTSAICNRSNMYQCVRSSKCISINRLIDTIYDCPYMDDENNTDINNHNQIEYFNKTLFKCVSSGKYIHPSLVGNNKCDCGLMKDGWCEDEDELLTYRKKNLLFQHICDGWTDLLPMSIDERIETDETECNEWACNNIYSRCRNVWNCPNGVDENGCAPHSTLNCSSKHQLCVSPDTNKFICLPIEKVNDGYADCLGGTDEPASCGKYMKRTAYVHDYVSSFYCRNQSSEPCAHWETRCDGFNNCTYRDDEQFCTTNITSLKYPIVCNPSNFDIISDVEKFLCNFTSHKKYSKVKYFLLNGMTDLNEDRQVSKDTNVISVSASIDQRSRRCYRGIDILVWLKNNAANQACLCPPSFYGSQCQYENQRVSLTLKFLALASSLKIPFAIIISLIDNSDKRIIHSYEQFTFLSLRDCQMKYHSYLLYSTRPKDLTKNYSIHIDIYEKISLKYRGSLLFPVQFPFLPVQREVFIVDIPRSDDKNRNCFDKKCINGKCIRYSNKASIIHFCQCNPGWSGKYCTIRYDCQCSSDSSCLGISYNNRSICVCPINKFGPRCVLIDPTCETNFNSTCQNGGQCISNINSKLSNQDDFICICRKGFSGNRCEINDTKLILSFDEDIIISQQIFIHFIDLISMRIPVEFAGRATTFRKIPFQQNSVVVYWPERFHLVFIEFPDRKYYLTVVRNFYNASSIIIETINSLSRCPPIDELFNQTFVKMPLIRRIKYYHKPCQNRSLNISCFYDEIHFCLCYEYEEQRLANCFKFDHNQSLDCSGQNECENGGRCLQNRIDCPTTSLCICPPCFYGTRCQFQTSGFGLSLDAILGYQIFPNISLSQQPIIIKTSLSLSIIFFILGLLNGIFSLIMFKNKSVCEVGCGLYLLCSSLTSIFVMILFGLKFWILLAAQMSTLSNRLFLNVQCYSMDFLLRVCLSLDQWLNACVAVERAFITIKGPRFIKKKSKQMAKFVILMLAIVTIGTCIHDPISREVIDEENDFDDEKRSWCVVRYSSNMQFYNSIINGFHFTGPIILNLVSTIILIAKKSHQQLIFHPDQKYKHILFGQFGEYKHLLIAPIVLVIVALPRLIITYVSECMDSINDSWLFLFAYLIPYIAPMLTFIIFIYPSEFYMKVLKGTLIRYRKKIQRRLNLTS